MEIISQGWFGWVFFLAFAAWDIWAELTGRETFSRYIIKTSKKHKWFAWFVFFLIIGIFSWLIVHFELISILGG